MKPLTLDELKLSARDFAQQTNRADIPDLYGVTDGKAVGTYIERIFNDFLRQTFVFETGSAALGIDFPGLDVDLKVTSIRQPQSSCPFRSAHQKIYGLGYHLLVFVYDKADHLQARTARLEFLHVLFVHQECTGDYQTTRGLLDILARDANLDDVAAFLEERHLPLDETGRLSLARQILAEPPRQGYLTISNALQWRLQYSRVITLAQDGMTPGVEALTSG
jgi:hypothetical protein